MMRQALPNWQSKLLASTALIVLASLAPQQAQAGLVGAGNTVQAFYYNGVLASPEGEIITGGSTSDPASLAAPLTYQLGAADGSTIAVNDLQIVITNQLSGAPFCVANLVGTNCTDAIDGFDFLFTGENILGVSVDGSTPAGFLPVSGTFQSNTHFGLQLLSPNEIRVDVTGDEPAQFDSLTLDLVFSRDTTPPPTGAPEPVTLSLFGAGLVGAVAIRRRRKAKNA